MSLTNHPFNRLQLYAENTGLEYPLDDLAGQRLPTDLLVDMAITVPGWSREPRLACIRITPVYVFLSIEEHIEDSEGEYWAPLAHLMQVRPVADRLYRLTCAAGGHGWVVFGSGVQRPLPTTRPDVAIDPRCVRIAPSTGRTFMLSVNGMPHTMPAVLRIRHNNYVATALAARQVAGEAAEVPCVVLRRDDAAIPDVVVRSGLAAAGVERGAPLMTINNVPPAEDGTYTIALDARDHMEYAGAGAIVQDGLRRGAVILTGDMAGCPDTERALLDKIRNGRDGHGTSYDLPLDTTVPPAPAKQGCA